MLAYLVLDFLLALPFVHDHRGLLTLLALPLALPDLRHAVMCGWMGWAWWWAAAGREGEHHASCGTRKLHVHVEQEASSHFLPFPTHTKPTPNLHHNPHIHISPENNACHSLLLPPPYIPYALRPDWEDIQPLPQASPAHEVVPIDYPDEYRDATDYLRAVLASG